MTRYDSSRLQFLRRNPYIPAQNYKAGFHNNYIPAQGISSGSAPFTPATLSNCQYWFDATDESTITDVSGAVTEWENKGLAGNNLKQGTALNRPVTGTRTINSLNTIDFDGTNHYLLTDNPIDEIATNGLTTYVVFESDSLASAQSLYGTWSSTEAQRQLFLLIQSTGECEFFYDDPADRKETATGIVTATGTEFLTSVYDGTQGTEADRVEIYDKGTLLSTSMSGNLPSSIHTSTVALHIGANPNGLGSKFNGKFAELIMYSEAHDSTKRGQVTDYIKDKYGIA